MDMIPKVNLILFLRHCCSLFVIAACLPQNNRVYLRLVSPNLLGLLKSKLSETATFAFASQVFQWAGVAPSQPINAGFTLFSDRRKCRRAQCLH